MHNFALVFWEPRTQSHSGTSRLVPTGRDADPANSGPGHWAQDLNCNIIRLVRMLLVRIREVRPKVRTGYRLSRLITPCVSAHSVLSKVKFQSGLHLNTA